MKSQANLHFSRDFYY